MAVGEPYHRWPLPDVYQPGVSRRMWDDAGNAPVLARCPGTRIRRRRLCPHARRRRSFSCARHRLAGAVVRSDARLCVTRPDCSGAASASRAALDRNADLLHPRERRELANSDAGPWRSKLAAQDFRDRFGKALEHLMRVVRSEGLQPLHDSRVIECILETVAAEYLRGGQLELEIQQQRLCQMLFPLVDADARLDAQIVDENSVHGPRNRNGGR